ncbi:hypothetical protein G9A89_002918 [Geosiphon pyriformis]|nr:hypothetical protein G9A89_002918 [Geosiphon pyriformis]
MVVSDKAVGGFWGSEAGDTIESNSVNIEEEFLIEKTSVDYGKSNLLKEKDVNQTPKRPKVVTKINFLSNNSNDNVLSGGYLELPFPLKNLVNVPVQKSFALDIGLKKVTGKSSQEKLSAVRKLFSGINGFGGASTFSRFAGIIRATFTSELSLVQASKKAGDAKILVNTNLKKPTGYSDRAVMVEKILVGTLVETVHAALSEFGSVVLIKMQLVGLWQKTVVEFVQLDQADLVAARWSILIRKDAVKVAKANSDKESWNTRDQHRALLYTLPIGTNAHDIWDFISSVGEKTCVIDRHLVTYVWTRCAIVCFDSAALINAVMRTTPCVKYENLGHTSLDCSVNKKTSSGGLARRILSESNKSRLASIYAKHSALIFHPVSFGGISWANIVGGSSFSSLPVCDESAFSGFSLEIKPTLLVSVKLNNRFAALEHSFASLVECVDKLAKRLDSPGPMNQGADIVMNESSGVATSGETIVEVAVFDPSVVSKIEKTLHNLSVTVMGLLAKIDNAGLVPNKDVVHWHIDFGNMVSIVTEMKLRSNIRPWIMNKFDEMKIFFSGLDNGFLGAGVMIIVNNSLVHHVSKIEEVPGYLLSIRLLFKGKLSVVILGLYAGASAETRFGQACEINSFIAKTANFSTFIILGGDFNEDRSRKSGNLKFCSDLGLIIDYIFVSKNLSSALAGHEVTSVSDFFNTDHNAVLVSVGLGGLLDSHLNSKHKQTNKDKWKFKIKDVDANKWSHFREYSLDKFLENMVSFNNTKVNGDLNVMWKILKDVVFYSADKVFSRHWFSEFDCLKNKLSSKFFKLELLVAKLVKCLSLGEKLDAVHLFKVWSNLDNKGASKVCTMFNDNETRVSILQHLLRVKKCFGLAIQKSFAPVSLPVCWSNQYAPLDHVSNNAFSKVMNMIKSDEFLLIVKKLPDRKAAGMSGIPNKLWKHGDAQVLGEGTLTNIRPIALIETAKKILSKVLSNRISLACSVSDVLCGDNFLVLKGTSTQTPIFTVGSIIEDAFEKNRELWLVLQNMQKAYDSTNRVMTNFSLTDGYVVHNGLD